MKNRLCAKILLMALLLLLVSSIMTSGLAAILYTKCTKCGKTTAHAQKIIKVDDRLHRSDWECPVCGTVIKGGLFEHSGGVADCDNKPICDGCGEPYGNALGHQWEVTYQWSNGNSRCIAYGTCKNNAQHSDSAEATVTSTYTEPTCSTPDKTTYTATFSASWAETQVRTASTGNTSRDAHKWGYTTYTWSPDYETCTAKRVCTLNSSHIETEVATASSDTIAEAKCIHDGCIIHTATFEASWAYMRTNTETISAPGHDPVHHEAKAATCTEKGWNAYDTCTRCNYSTYEEIAPKHDLENHTAKAPTCLEIGWEAYETCKREGCNYTTYSELPIDSNNHALVRHEAQAATCTEIGWDEYDTCTRCDYSTYEEIALKHDYQKTVVKPTCEKDGYTRYTCARCEDSYTENPVKKLLHWYGEWMPNGDGTHSADCRRADCRHVGKTDCQKFDFIVEIVENGENEHMVFCPVCGEVENGERLELIEKATATAVTGKLPSGELVARMNQEYLSLAFEYAGKLTTPRGQVTITLPAETLQAQRLVLVAPDGTETELPFELAGEEISFTVDFAEGEIPVMLLKLVAE